MVDLPESVRVRFLLTSVGSLVSIFTGELSAALGEGSCLLGKQWSLKVGWQVEPGLQFSLLPNKPPRLGSLNQRLPLLSFCDLPRAGLRERERAAPGPRSAVAACAPQGLAAAWYAPASSLCTDQSRLGN